MITKATLRQIVMLGYLTDEMLDKLIPLTEYLQFGEGEYIFRQGEKADRLYMLQQGKVLLEQQISDKVTVSMSAIRPGYSFGWSAMLDEGVYSTDAVTAEPSTAFSFREDRIKALMEKDHDMGYILSQRLLRVIKRRYDIRTEQFIKVIRHHPDIAGLL
jgi:CRP/FNR family cyclic AMP-dependent transcriptional regulator